MTEHNDTAFPVTDITYGMTKREYFAALMTAAAFLYGYPEPEQGVSLWRMTSSPN